ncbi:MAG: GAF domain-containing protein [Alicyclobacillaceae bacterium]|nr:GAF domain-containing protein [Alicyclobacillaceae bacterium]
MDDVLLTEQLEQALSRSGSQREMFAAVLEWFAEFLGIDRCSLHVYSESERRLTHVLSIGVDADLIDATYSIPLGDGAIGQAAEALVPVSVPDLREQPLSWPHLVACERAGIRSMWTVPIVSRQQLLGTITAYLTQVDHPTNHDRYLRMYAAQTVAEPLLRALESRLHPVMASLQRLRQGADPSAIRGFIRPEVLESWLRCRELFGERARPFDPPRLTDGELHTLQQSNYNLLRAARQYLGSLFRQVHELNCAALLCDADGWLLEVMGDARCVNCLADNGITPGTNVSEPYLGNNAIGTALATRRATWFHAYEHYFPEYHHWSTAGAPIILEDGERLTGAFAFCTLQPSIDTYLPLLAQAAAIGIAHWLQLEEYRQDVVRVHQGVLSHLDYHVVLVDTHGHISDERHPIPVGDDIRAAMLETIKLGECSENELSLGDRVYLVDVRNLWDHRGQFKGTLGLFRDITNRKQMELRMRDAEKLAVLTSLAAGIAHEIRNPLTTARGFLQLFAKRLESETDKRFLDLTIQELDRINQLVKDFMTLAKPDVPSYNHVNLTEVLQGAVEFIRPEASLRGVPLTVKLPGEAVWIWADANQIKQLVLNIIQNALQACDPHDDTVTVELLATADTAVIVVADTGCGMSEVQIHQMFEPFYTTKPTGTGLGMAISKRIVDEHQGHIEVESQPGLGTTVRIQLSRVAEPTGMSADRRDIPQDGEPEGPQPARPAAGDTRSGVRNDRLAAHLSATTHLPGATRL